MKRLLFIGGMRRERINGGADQVNNRNIALLERLFGNEITFIPTHGGTLVSKLSFGITDECLAKINAELQTGQYSHVFICHSLYGRAVKFVKKHYPHIPIIAFFHNVEVDYAKSFLKTSGPTKLPFFLASRHWERQTCKYADKVITLNHRDSRRLKEVYGVTATAELPTSFSDTYDENKAQKLDAGSQSEITYLFVGRAFFANVEGVQWFITNVLPNIKGTLYVVGSGMDKDAFADLTNRVKILGYVDNLSEVYYKARFVVSPILSGAGMKTKTAEALMFGKTIIGTTEAFEGYELTDGATYLCNTADEWISTINRLKSQSSNINLVSRSLFKKNHCTEALIEVLAQVIKL
jgi:hypothetical protein